MAKKKKSVKTIKKEVVESFDEVVTTCSNHFNITKDIFILNCELCFGGVVLDSFFIMSTPTFKDYLETKRYLMFLK